MQDYDDKTEAKKLRSRTELVLYAGLVSSAVTLVGVYFLNTLAGINIMGWYANFIIPIGALIVGVAAGSGYALAARKFGVKLTKLLLVSVFCLQVVSYGAAQYIEYETIKPTYANGQPVSFWEWFDYSTQSFSFNKRNGQSGSPLGLLGYGVRLLEIAGFALGAVGLSAIAGSTPYCDACQSYMAKRRVALIPAGLALSRKDKKKLNKPDGEELRKALEVVSDSAAERLDEIVGHFDLEDYEAFAAALQPFTLDIKATDKLSSRFSITLIQCGSCLDGYLKVDALHGHGEELLTEPLTEQPLPVGFRDRIGEDFN